MADKKLSDQRIEGITPLFLAMPLFGLPNGSRIDPRGGEMDDRASLLPRGRERERRVFPDGDADQRPRALYPGHDEERLRAGVGEAKAKARQDAVEVVHLSGHGGAQTLD